MKKDIRLKDERAGNSLTLVSMLAGRYETIKTFNRVTDWERVFRAYSDEAAKIMCGNKNFPFYKERKP